MPSVLIVDDEKPIRDAVRTILEYENFQTLEASSGKEALGIIPRERPDAVLLDIKMPGMDGLETLERIQGDHPELPVVMFSGHGNIPTAVEAIRKGAYDFIEKPPDADKILVTLNNAVEHRKLKSENRALRRRLSGTVEFIGESPSMAQVLETIEKIATSEVGVLITGENGTGKELVARAIHMASDRSLGPFVDVNCAAIPHDLIESELFGHEAGSFTGATGRRTGKFEQAHQGSLFLDEVGDMSEAAQAKILRVLETREVERVGGNKKIPVNVRVLTATNKDLKKSVEEGTFRLDLYYRLNVIPVHLTPLRERREDIPLLCRHFLSKVREETGRETLRIDKEAMALLTSLDWPGNVRELKNFMERLSVLSGGQIIGSDDVKRALDPGCNASEDPFESAATFEEFKEKAERQFFLKKLAKYEWNIKRTADALKMQRRNLYKKIEKYGLK
ncbi:MAG: sigma-54-dependent transcriptional regulator [Planctomycetota bacterium]|jgi:two-component system nitrogen regulation response regulator NtrX